MPSWLCNAVTLCAFDYCTIFITGRNEVVAKVMFLQVSVILSTGGISGEPIPPTKENPPRRGRHPPTRQTPPPGPRRTPPGPRRTPQRGRHPPPDQGEPPPPREEDCSIRSMSGRYASYWNAFLFISNFHCIGIFYSYLRVAFKRI